MIGEDGLLLGHPNRTLGMLTGIRPDSVMSFHPRELDEKGDPVPVSQDHLELMKRALKRYVDEFVPEEQHLERTL